MEKTTEYLKRGDWRQALVRLWTLADHATLSQWETLFSARQLANQVAAFQTRLLEETPRIKPDDIAANPLALIQALDYVVATQFADMPFSAVPYAEDGKKFWLLPTPPTQVERARRSQQSGSLRHFSPHHVVAPCRVGDIDIMVTVATGQLHSSLARMAQQNVSALRCWVAHFDDGCEIQWQQHGAAKRLLASAIAPTEIRTQSALAMLASANGTSASVVVAPELTLDLAHRDAMGRWIWNQPTAHRPLLVLPGSWHEFHNGEVFNCAPLMDGTRWEPLFSHRKLTAYGTYGDGGTEDLIEAIHVGAALHVLVTPIGTFTVLVCKDFIDVDAQLRSLLQVVPVN